MKIPKEKKTTVPKIRVSEHQLQSLIFNYVDKVLPDLRPFMFAIPNGGQRNFLVACKLKAEGVTAGVWDIFICLPNVTNHGLFIECKVGKNVLTNSQKGFKETVSLVGYKCEECRSLPEFEDILVGYFDLLKLTNKEILSRIDREKTIQKNFI